MNRRLRMLRAPIALAVTCSSAVLATVACTDITALEQENPGQLSAATLYIPANAQLLVNGAIADFECAFSRYVVGSALLGDEVANAIAGTANFDYDRRTLPTDAPYGFTVCGNNQQPPIYTTLSTARGSADTVLAKLKGWTDAQMPTGVDRTQLIGQAAAYAGYSLVLLGEAMCSAAINLGPELTPDELFAEAKLRFDEAVTAATTAGDDVTLNFARLGRARANLNLGDLAAAAVDAALIPAGFVVTTSTDAITPRKQNYSFVFINNNNYGTVDPNYRNVTINGAPDPRVAVTNTGVISTSQAEVWTPDKYSEVTTPMPIARWAEAQLILAEARVAANDLAGAAAAINAVRATHPGLPTYDPTGQTQAQVLAQVIEERRRELFLEGTRFGDVRRYDLPLVPAPGVVFPGGGGTYGDQRCFPLPDVERINNPSLN